MANMASDKAEQEDANFQDLINEFDDNDEDLDTIPCNLDYILVCICMPTLNGALNAFVWPAYTLHFDNMNWSLVSAGLSITLGFVLRMITQQLQLYTGYWLIVPLNVIHLAFAVIGLLCPQQEWAVFAQIVAVQGIDPTCAIEGIAFDTFGQSESHARQATSTVLSVFTISVALSCTFGGILFDLGGWVAISVYHVIVEAALVLILIVQPACGNSFKEVFLSSGEDQEDEEVEDGVAEAETEPEEPMYVSIIPAPIKVGKTELEETLPAVKEEEERLPEVKEEETLPGAVADRTEAAGEEPEVDELREKADKRATRMDPAKADRSSHVRDRSSRARSSARCSALQARKSRRGTTHSTVEPVGMTRLTIRNTRNGRFSMNSSGTSGSRTAATGAHRRATAWTAKTGASGSTMLTALSRVATLSQAGQDFRHHFGTSGALVPQIVGSSGKKSAVLREEVRTVDEEGHIIDPRQATSTGKIPRDLRFPSVLLMLNCLCNTGSYVIEFATFAIYFRQVHEWENATWSSLAQTAGDVLAAIAMQVIPVFFNFDYNPDDLSGMKRFLHYMTTSPYNLTTVLCTWLLWNFGMMSPWLPLAITAQVFMGTTFVYSSRWACDMNLFYSLGDAKVFLTFQIYCRTAESFGGCIGGLLALWLFSIDPSLPFAFSAGMAWLVWLIYTMGFCSRLGFGEDIETKEQKRATLKGITRVNNWAVKKEKHIAEDSWAAGTKRRRKIRRMRVSIHEHNHLGDPGDPGDPNITRANDSFIFNDSFIL